MPSFKLKKFSHPDALKEIAPDLLVQFLRPYDDYLSARNFDLSPAAALDYERLVSILVNPDEDIPEPMVDALFFVHEMSDAGATESLLELAEKRGVVLSLSEDPSPADVAIALWLTAPRLLEEKHGEAAVLRPRSFEYYAGSVGGPREFPECDSRQLSLIEQRLEEWFVAKLRGEGTRVFIFRHADKVLVLVRHGTTMRREGSIRKGARGVAYFRPEVHDVLVYDESADVLGIHASTKGEHTLYNSVFADVLFGDAKYFAKNSEISLEPLIRYGQEALACEDVPGVRAVRLVEVRRYVGGETKERVVNQSADLFRTFGDDWRRRLSFGRLTGATFEVLLGDGAKPRRRRVSLICPNLAKYDRDDEDARTMELWLRRRGFMAGLRAADDEHHHTALGTPLGSALPSGMAQHRPAELAGASG